MVVLNPGKLAIIYTSTKKTDKENALKIARLLETMPEEYLPLVPLPSEAEEEMRRLASSQMFLNKERTRLINRHEQAALLISIPGVVIEEGKAKAEIESFFSALKNRITRWWEAGNPMQKRMLGYRDDFYSQVPCHCDHA